MGEKLFEVRDAGPHGKERKHTKKTVASRWYKVVIWGDTGTSRTDPARTVWSWCIAGEPRGIKKDLSADLTALKNREKAVIIGDLREKYALMILLTHLHMTRSSYYYHQTVMNKPQKSLFVRAQIISIFQENRGVYGYGRINLALKREDITHSKKVIRHIMKEEGLVAFIPK